MTKATSSLDDYLGLLEAHPVLARIGLGLPFIPLETQIFHPYIAIISRVISPLFIPILVI